MVVCAFFCASCTRDRGCSVHPAFPALSVLGGARFGASLRAHRAAGSRSCVRSHSTQDSIPIRPLHSRIWPKMKLGSGGARPPRPSEETLPVRHYDWIAHFGRRTPDKIAAVDLASQRRLTYAQFDARISRLATHLRDRLEVVRGDRVAVLALNTTDTLEVQFACGRIGAGFLPLNTRLTPPQPPFIVGDASPQ